MNKGTLATNVAKVEAKEKELAEAKAKAKVISHACSLATPPAVPWFHRAAHTESVCARLANLVCACVRDGGGYGGKRRQVCGWRLGDLWGLDTERKGRARGEAGCGAGGMPGMMLPSAHASFQIPVTWHTVGKESLEKESVVPQHHLFDGCTSGAELCGRLSALWVRGLRRWQTSRAVRFMCRHARARVGT